MTLAELNQLPVSQRKAALTTCCGSSVWVDRMASLFPFETAGMLFEQAETTWLTCAETDWREAFTHHPKIGDIDSLRAKFASTKAWAAGEQAGVSSASQQILEELAEGNRLYEEKFGYIFIICATGKSAGDMLDSLNARLPNAPEAEIRIAMQEQGKITRIRLEKLLT
ncbi:2-oxo-4-hydroxy-4-carboxy-5-ureidoimidazoline decarboxylase [Spirosoma luteum]|uniref:2-oxo-4-hydroxy-4-carboxy-5-ureidoimidazoline decarboxylase n=1 Tax=Spirosoma luteum TaxID=431553 RepID=UPI00036D6BA6|nr:2-oxo-4-hydroxy-4-carboxy-5-ureidoimidazoline decarboxylase [Spirosoma luteum]